MGLEGKKVLVVDDEADMREFIMAVLEDDGCEFITAENGDDGIAKARSESPDLVILDVQMPVKDGFQTLTELRADEATASIPVIMLTGITERTGLKFDAASIGEFHGCEPDAYLEKPIAPDSLRETVTKVMG